MSQFEYIMIPIGIVVGLALAHLLAGLGKTLFRMTGHGQPIKASWVHTLWVLNTGFWVVAYWFYIFRSSDTQSWSFGMYLLMLPTPIVMYLQCVLLFPHRFDVVADVGEYFLDIRRWYFGLFVASVLVDFLDGAFGATEGNYLAGLGGSYILITLLSVAIPVGGSLTRSKRALAALGIVLLLAQIWQMFNDHPFLGSTLPGGL